MYFDNRPCDVCGAQVRLEPHDPERDTVVEPDGTLDERVCTNPQCPTNTGATNTGPTNTGSTNTGTAGEQRP